MPPDAIFALVTAPDATVPEDVPNCKIEPDAIDGAMPDDNTPLPLTRKVVPLPETAMGLWMLQGQRLLLQRLCP